MKPSITAVNASVHEWGERVRSHGHDMNRLRATHVQCLSSFCDVLKAADIPMVHVTGMRAWKLCTVEVHSLRHLCGGKIKSKHPKTDTCRENHEAETISKCLCDSL